MLQQAWSAVQPQLMIGRAPAFRRALELMHRYAGFDAPVLITGETGTGKELFARAIHHLGSRSTGPFIPVNCGALPDSLLEDELFGHLRGAYTDARADRDGLIAQAQGGTLFLDEVDALTARAQVALLRFLQDRRYQPLGGASVRDADIRIVASTNSDLAALVKDGGFRGDLLFRLDVATLQVPPLRARLEDVVLLAKHFLGQFAARYDMAVPTLSAQVETALIAYGWPGNVRELENTMHRALILAEQHNVDRLTLGVLATQEEAGLVDDQADPAPFSGGLKAARARQCRSFDRRYVSWLLDRTNGNVAAAAREAGTERRNLGRILKRLGVEPDGFREGRALGRVE